MSSEYTFHLIKTEQGYAGAVFKAKRITAFFLPQAKSRTLGEIRRAFPGARPLRKGAVRFKKDIRNYLSGKKKTLTAAIDWSCMRPFDRSVLRATVRIPRGQTASYGKIARAIGHQGAARAVGSALGRNAIPLVIPCHRVVKQNGDIGGFSGPRGWKKRLLQLEGAIG